ncbi:hypothetical protein M0812_01119 [Anaeramoeba flamelloides]|uniref:Uncharacterized protein n=1 Tax=Anaeramoeba flamelloides TaxID=1746091 RepID=A0AAV8A7B5_9EUKA|nr:hypothetical protein M0812_01119 [Anaeramoeba flamelloides]
MITRYLFSLNTIGPKKQQVAIVQYVKFTYAWNIKKIHECYPLNKHIILAINNQRKTQTKFIDNNRNPFARKPNVESQKRKNLFLFNNKKNSLFKQKEKEILQQKEKKKNFLSETNKENELAYQHKTSTSLSQRPKARTDAAKGGKIFDPFYSQNKMNKKKGTNEKKKKSRSNGRKR